MLPLSESELHQMRDVVSVVLGGTAVIHTRSTVSDGQGGKIESYAASGTVSALLAPLAGEELEAASRLSSRESHVLTVPHSTTIARDSLVVYASRTYEVVQVKAWTPYELHRRVLVAEIL